MPIDASIPLSYKFPQFQSPGEQQREALTLAGLIDQQRQRQRGQEDEMALRGVMQRTGGDPAKAIQALLAQGTPKSIELASKLDGLIKKTDQGFTLTPGAQRFGPDGKVIAQVPPAPVKSEASPEIVRLGTMLGTLPVGHPMRKSIQARIDVLSSRAPAVQVNMPASSDLMQRPDGTFVRVRIGKNGQVEQIPLGNVTPPETAAQSKATAEAREGDQAVANVKARIAKMAQLIQGGAMAGATVGPLGLASRVGETVAGAMAPNQPTPAIDFKNEQSLLLADVRKMVEKDPNLSKDERERLYETLGGGITQTPGSAIRTLNNVLNYVESKKATPSRAARLERRVPAIGTVQDGYKFKGGDPSKRENWEKQ